MLNRYLREHLQVFRKSRTSNVKSSVHSMIKSEPKLFRSMSACLFLSYGRCCLTGSELVGKPAAAMPKSAVKNSPCPLPPNVLCASLNRRLFKLL